MEITREIGFLKEDDTVHPHALLFSPAFKNDGEALPLELRTGQFGQRSNHLTACASRRSCRSTKKMSRYYCENHRSLRLVNPSCPRALSAADYLVLAKKLHMRIKTASNPLDVVSTTFSLCDRGWNINILFIHSRFLSLLI